MAVLRACAPVIIFGDNRKRLKIAKDMGADYAIHIDEVADPVAEVKRLPEAGELTTLSKQLVP